MTPRPTDAELAESLSDEFARQERARRNSLAMNALLRGQHPEGTEPSEDDEPADMNATIRTAAGRPYTTKNKEQS